MSVHLKLDCYIPASGAVCSRYTGGKRCFMHKAYNSHACICKLLKAGRC
jgi:hypothetical protein